MNRVKGHEQNPNGTEISKQISGQLNIDYGSDGSADVF